jgi:pyrroloquinoline quinone biosynthesis protein D
MNTPTATVTPAPAHSSASEVDRSAPCPGLRPGVRLCYDPRRRRHVLLSPETVLMPNATATAVLTLCDGTATASEIVSDLRERYGEVREQDVHDLLDRLTKRRLVEWS